MDLTVPKGIFAALLALAVVQGTAAAADIPKKSADVPALDMASVSEWERAFVRDSTITLYLRSYYLNRDTTIIRGPAAWAAGGALGYQSGWLGDTLRVSLAGFTSQPVWAPADRDGTLLLKPGQQGYSVLGLANVSLKLWDQVFTGYRQIVDQPEVNSYDIRMTPQTFQGYTFAGRVNDLSYTVAYLDQMKQINSDVFRNMAAVAGAPFGVNEPLWLGSLSYSPVKNFAARLSSYHVPNILTSTYSDFAWLVPLGNPFQIRVGGQFMYQGSTGANLLTGSSFETWAGGAKADLIWGPATASVAYTQTGRGAAYRTPYGGWAGYTSMIVNDFDRAGETAFLVGAAFDFAALNLPGLSFFTDFVFGRNAIEPISGFRLPDRNEYDFTLDYRFTASNWPDYLAPLWLRARCLRRSKTGRLHKHDNGLSSDFELPVGLQVQMTLACKKMRGPKPAHRGKPSLAECGTGGLPSAIVAARADRNHDRARGRNHLGALDGGVLRRNILELHALRRDHPGLRHHHGLVARGDAMRDALARRNHHSLVVGLILRRDDLLLIAGDARLRPRHVAAVTAGEGGGRRGSERKKRRRGKRGKNALHDDTSDGLRRRELQRRSARKVVALPHTLNETRVFTLMGIVNGRQIICAAFDRGFSCAVYDRWRERSYSTKAWHSISTFMRGSTSPFTSTSVEAGRLSPKYAMRRGLIFGRSVMSVMKTCTLTTCSGPAPAAFRHLSITAMAISNWATTSDGMLPSCAVPTTPATQTCGPRGSRGNSG